ncbi:MAG: hypothetical protein K0R76_410 [Alphaproteobacteria bacterium]|jgi:UDP-N-acetylglucosamine 2-epimerase (non-hydrolysing)|nr:hypothetical protein [Alphaproteobacteria bacterium]
MQKLKILTVFGTRPEVIKLAPFIKAVEADLECVSVTCATTQHRELQNNFLDLFHISPHHDLGVMVDGQDLFHITESVISQIKKVFDDEKPDFTVVQGDTTTSFAAALASFYKEIPVVHIEAGLRTRNIYRPYPEEANRAMTSRIASLNMAPTETAMANLAQEGITANAFKVGNTIVDAVDWILQAKTIHSAIIKKVLQAKQKKVLITIHRRENFGLPLQEMCFAIREISLKYPDYLFIWPVHPNPNLNSYVHTTMKNIPNMCLIEPVSYVDLISLLKESSIILSDSGGIQEESFILEKRIIILREETERPEVVDSGYGVLAGHDKDVICGYFEKIIEEGQTFLGKQHPEEVYGKPGVSKNILSKIKSS